MGLCGSSVNLEMISDDADDDVDVPSGGWTVGTLEQKIIELVDLLSASTKKALSLKRAKKIKAAKRELQMNLKPLKRRISILRAALIEKNKEAERWTEEEKSDILKIQPSHLRVAPRIVKCDIKDLYAKYKISDEKLGDGMGGDVNSVVERKSQTRYAIKRIYKSRFDDVVVDQLRAEVEVLSALDHPNVVRVVEAFETKDEIVMILELGLGGDLFDFVQKQKDKKCSIELARDLTRQIARALAHCHAQGIVHRDVKLENFVFSKVLNSKKKNVPVLKLIDFGLSKQWQLPGTSNCIQVRKMNTIVGTLDTSAPEVRDRDVMYTSKCDMWSLGAVAFKLISGKYPFQGKNRNEVIASAKAGKYSFDDDRGWKNVPDRAKDFIRKLLCVNPTERMAAREALTHPWLLTRERRQSKDKLLKGDFVTNVIDAMTKFEKLNAMQRTALLIHAHLRQSSHDSESSASPLHELFLAVDKDFSGDITMQEFGDAFKQKFREPKLISRIFNAIDQDGSGLIHYTEFLAACLFVSPKDTIKFEMDAETVFDKLDTDRDGLISESNLREILGPMCTRSYVCEIFGETSDDDDDDDDDGGRGDDNDSKDREDDKKTKEERKIDRNQFKRLIGLVKDACNSMVTPDFEGGDIDGESSPTSPSTSP